MGASGAGKSTKNNIYQIYSRVQTYFLIDNQPLTFACVSWLDLELIEMVKHMEMCRPDRAIQNPPRVWFR